MQTYAYIRVSTREQNEDRQVIAMKEFGVEEKNIVVEKQSGKDFECPLYWKLVKKLKPDDTFVIKSIVRLGRNYNEVLEQWRCITKEKQANIVVLDMPLLDTRNGYDLTGTLIADIFVRGSVKGLMQHRPEESTVAGQQSEKRIILQKFAGDGRMEKYSAEQLHGGSEYHTIHFVHG